MFDFVVIVVEVVVTPRLVGAGGRLEKDVKSRRGRAGKKGSLK